MGYEKQSFLTMLAAGLCSKARKGKELPTIYIAAGLRSAKKYLSAEEYTWAEIKAISEAGEAPEAFKLGDTKTFTLTTGEKVVMEIVAFDADEKADGTTVGITWMSKYTLNDSRQMHSVSDIASRVPWVGCDMRNWLRGDFYDTMPSDVKAVIETVQKTYTDNSSYDTLTCEDNVWLPSVREIDGPGDFAADKQRETSGVIYSDFFADAESRVKYTTDGESANWWLRTGWFSNETIKFVASLRIGYSYGNAGGRDCTNTFGVVIGFCT